MKLKITEQQLKFIIENEIPDDNNIMEINMEDYDDIGNNNSMIAKILRDCKLKKCNGIRLIGDFNFNNFIISNVDVNLLEIFCNKLIEIKGDFGLQYTKIESFLKLSKVEGNLDLSYSKIKLLPVLSEVKGILNLFATPIEELPELKTVEGNLHLGSSEIVHLPKLKKVSGHAYLANTPIGKNMSKYEIRHKFGIEKGIQI